MVSFDWKTCPLGTTEKRKIKSWTLAREENRVVLLWKDKQKQYNKWDYQKKIKERSGEL